MHAFKTTASVMEEAQRDEEKNKVQEQKKRVVSKEMQKFLALDIKRPSSVLFMARRSMSAGRELGTGDDSTQNINSVNADKLLNQLKLCPSDAALPKLLPNKASPKHERNYAF